jgi:tetratricopeptide (TPR) repeat protein
MKKANNMKRIFLTIIISALTIVTFAQSQNITSSAIIFKQYNSEKDKAKKEVKIIEAKDYIDLAYENASTSNEPKMWMYRAQIYKIIAFNYSNLDSKAIFKATESHVQCMQPHPKKKNKIVIYKKWPEQEVFNGLMQCANKLFNLAVESYQEGKYQESLDYYKPIHGVIDLDKEGQLKSIKITTESLIHNSYLCAKAMKNNDLSKDYLQKLMDMNSTNPSIYSSMSAIYMDEGNSDKALEYIALGREMFEMDQGLVNTEINLYIQLGRTSELIGILGEALELDPENDLLLFNRGTIYDQQGDFINAEADYKSSLAINPFAFGTNYNLGALYFNTAIEQNNKANATSNNSTHKKLKSKADALFAKALPFLEKAYLIDSKDKNTLLSLKQLYYMNGDYAKSSEMKKIIEGLK